MTRCQTYTVLENDSEKQQVKIRGDNGRVRWYPYYCFAVDGEPVFTVQSFTIDDEIDDPLCDAVDITLTLTDGSQERRCWCYFLTPAYVSNHFAIAPSEPFISGRHGILIPELTVEQIEITVAYLEANDLLEDCTLPLSDEEDLE